MSKKSETRRDAEQVKYFDSSFDKLAQPSLRSFFGSVVKGQPLVYTTDFFQRSGGISKLLRDWKPVVEHLGDKFASLLAFENDMRSKVGPMSVRLPLEDRLQDIDSYYDSILLESKPIDRNAINRTCDEYSRAAGIRLRSQRETLLNMRLSTNSGSPYFMKRSSAISKTYPCTVEVEQSYVNQFLKNGSRKYTATAILGWRGQEGGLEEDDVKQRVVWMFPFAVNLCELQVYQPMIQAFQKHNLIPAWVSMEAVDDHITKLFDTKGSKDLIVCTDFSKFDQHFNSHMQEAAYSVLSFLLTDGQTWLRDVFPIKYMIPLAYNYDAIRFGKHGMGSGSGGTNADESLAHRALQHEAALMHGEVLNQYSMCLGDDGILSYPGITTEDVVKTYVRHGLEMNPDKQYASTEDCVYLRRWHSTSYRIDGVAVGVYSTYRALGRMCYTERYMDPRRFGPEAVALRQLSILENCKYHPFREDFVQFCMKRDKYRLGVDIPGFLDNVTAIAKDLLDVMPDYLGYTKSLQSGNDPTSGIKGWWIVQYLLNQR